MTYDLTYQRAEGPSGGAQPGTIALTTYITSKWSGTRSLGIYNPRMIRGSSTSWSIHAEGRAVDIGVGLDADGEAIGDMVAEWVTDNASRLGVQYLIWNRQSWTQSRGWRAYTGVSPHRDHLHIEQTRLAAAQLTDGDIAALTVTIPDGPHGRVTPEFDPPIELRDVISWCRAPGGGVWVLADNGDVYAIDAPYYGGPNHELRPITYDVLGAPARIEADGRGYTVITDRGYAYGYAP
jgi:hypothetical protein